MQGWQTSYLGLRDLPRELSEFELRAFFSQETAQMQAVLDRWAHRRQIVPPELIGRIAPTRLEGINLRGVFRFPVERYVGQLLPSQTAAKTSAGG